MTSLIMIVVSSALVSNVVLNQFLGICSFLGVSKQIKTSASLGAAVIFVITIASAVASLLYDYVLAPLNLDYLKTIVFILVIAALVQLVEMFLKKTSRAIYEALGIYLPLITTNCAVLGVALTNVQNGYNLLESVLSGFGTAIGYTIAIVLLAGIRGRLDEEAIPAPFRGAPIVLLCAALMSIALWASADCKKEENMQEIIVATLVIGVIGLVIGIALVAAGKKFYVAVDERVTQVRECLPGNNCGACGYAGCDAVASAIVSGEAPGQCLSGRTGFHGGEDRCNHGCGSRSFYEKSCICKV